MRNFLSLRLLVFPLAAGLGGCFTQEAERTSGVDDFPNSIFARVDGFLALHQSSGALPVLPTGAQTLIQGGGLPPAPKYSARSALAKAGASGAGAIWTWDTTKTLRDSLTGEILAVQIDTVQGTGQPGQEPIHRVKSLFLYTRGKIVGIDRLEIGRAHV